MGNKRDLNLYEYDISKYRYRELSNFCLQYSELINAKNDCYTLSSVKIGDTPKSNRLSDFTAINAERACRLGDKIEMIEQTAIELDSELYNYILKAVTEGLTWDDLLPPCGRRQFYQLRRKFFYLLNLKKG